MKWNKKIVAFLLLCFVLIAALIDFSFEQYRGQINEEFDQLVEENLTAYAESQKAEVQSMIKDVEGTLEAIATMVGSAELNPEGEWLTNYLQAIGEKQSRYQVTYSSMNELFGGLRGDNIRPEDWLTYDRLSRGETVISNVRLSKRLGNRYYFSIAVPVYQDDEVVGVLRSLLKADRLIQTLQTGYFRESIDSYLVKGSGEFVETSKLLPSNLFDALEPYLSDPEKLNSICNIIKQNQNTTCKLDLKDKGFVYVSTVSLGYNDWHIVNFTSAENVSHHSTVIMQYTVRMGVCLILLTAAAGLAIFHTLQMQKKKLHLEHARYAVLAEFSDTVLFQYYYKDQMLEFTSNAQKLLLLPSLQICCSEKSSVQLLHPEDRTLVSQLLKNPKPEGKIYHQEFRVLGLDNTYFWCLCQYQIFYNRKKKPAIIMGKLVDIRKQKERERVLVEKSELDVLTGLYNKATIENQIRLYLKEGCSHGFFYMIDIDNFKQVNDRKGHAEGDKLLAQIGQALRSIFREERDILGRVGGDEFAVFMKDTSDRTVAMNRAQRILEKIHLIGASMDEESSVSCSIGIVEWSGASASFEELYRTADHAMYLAKSKGKNRYEFGA